jgi:hypothetical protein
MLNLSARWGWVVSAMPQLLYPWKRTLWLIVREVCWAPGWSGWVWRGDNPLPGPGFNPWTVQLYQLHCPDLRQVLKAFDLFWNSDVIGKVRDVRHCSFLTSAPIGGDWSVSCFNSKVVHAISQALCWLWPQSPGSVPDYCVWVMWWTAWQWGGFILSTLHFPFQLSFCQCWILFSSQYNRYIWGCSTKGLIFTPLDCCVGTTSW